MYWKQWLQTLLSLVVLLGVLELLLPAGELARFAKLVLGLSLMLAVLQPLTLLVDPELLGVDLAWLPETGSAPYVQDRAERLRLAAVRALLEEGGQELKAQLEKALAGIEAVQRVRVELPLENGAAPVRVFIDPWEPATRREAEQLVSALLNLPLQHIVVLAWPE